MALANALELNDLPDEILEKVLLHAAALTILEGRQAETLKRVCRRWKVIVSGDVFRRLLKVLICSVDPSRRYVDNTGEPLRVLGVDLYNVTKLTAMKGELFVYDKNRREFVVYGHANLSAWGCRLPWSRKSFTVAEKRSLALRLPEPDYNIVMYKLSSCTANDSLYSYAYNTVDRSYHIIRTDAANGETTRIYNNGLDVDMDVTSSGHVVVFKKFQNTSTVYEYTENGELARTTDLADLLPNTRHWRILSAVSSKYLIYFTYQEHWESPPEYRFARVSDNNAVTPINTEDFFPWNSLILEDANDDGLYLTVVRSLFPQMISLSGSDHGTLRDLGEVHRFYYPVAYDRECGLLYIRRYGLAGMLKAVRLTRI